MALHYRRIGTLALLGALCCALAACLLSPGKFTSTLDIRKDGRFAFSYTGEITMLGLTKLAEEMAHKDTPDKFGPDSACFGPADGDGPQQTGIPKPRPCTPAEVARQKKDWDETQTASAASEKQKATQMQALFGGIDPTSPSGAQEFATRLSHQAGWKRVTYKGDGVFDVDFAIAGRLTHDFAFPTIEKMPYAMPFISVFRRADGTLRIDAPAFAAAGNSTAMMLGMMSAHAASGAKDGPPPTVATLDGHFTLTTDAEILANNTDEGPSTDAGGQKLEWQANPRTPLAPSALLRLAH